VRTCDETQGFGNPAFNDSYCEHLIYFPMVELDRSVPHTLRLVLAGREATVTVRASMHWQWIWFNGVWMAGAPIGWAVDAASGSMSYFNDLDVERAFRQASSGAGR